MILELIVEGLTEHNVTLVKAQFLAARKGGRKLAVRRYLEKGTVMLGSDMLEIDYALPADTILWLLAEHLAETMANCLPVAMVERDRTDAGEMRIVWFMTMPLPPMVSP